MGDDFAILDHKDKIKEFFEILQSQERHDLAKEMKKLFLKICHRSGPNKSERGAIDLPSIKGV